MNADLVATQLAYRPISSDLATRIRRDLRDDAGNELAVWTSDSHGNPCRHCLRLTKPGDDLILFSFDPFDRRGPYAERGPVFIHAAHCERYEPAAGFPPEFADRTLTLRAYGASSRGELTILDAVVASPVERGDVLARFFSDAHAAFVDARNPAWGCFDFRIVRS